MLTIRMIQTTRLLTRMTTMPTQTTTQRLTPVQVNGLTNVVGVAAGVYHSAALKSDGTVWAWGYNGNNIVDTT